MSFAPWRTWAAGLVVAAGVFMAGSARADIMQAPPDGSLIPHITTTTATCTSGYNVQACLDDSEAMLGGMAGRVSAIHNATIDQETFDPKCQLTFKVLSKGGSTYGHVFGWYPVKPGNTPPPLSDLHVFLNCQDTQMPGTTKVLTLPPGTGAIAFFEGSYSGFNSCAAPGPNGTVTVEPTYSMYTERRFNGRLRNGMPDPNPDIMQNFIRVLTWQSAARPDSFYFGWEDDGTQYSDQNFNDLVTLVSGIECSSGGQACDTGMKGFCANGTMQCRAGVLTCVPDQPPVPEKCNAVDDDCNGIVVEGDICPMGFVCFRGNCVPNCARGEFTCAGGTTCETDAGVCVDLACQNVSCPAGQVCRAGMCVGECSGVKCPYGQQCRHGGCVDVCSGLQCDQGFVCTPSYPMGTDKDPVGVCSNCGCQGCPSGTMCSAMHCVAGACVDNCAGATCPPGQKCSMGQCVTDGSAPRDAGKDTGPVVIDPTTGATTSGGTGPGSVTTGPGTTTTTGGSGGAKDAPGKTDGASCGCRVPGGRAPRGELVLLSLLGLAAFLRRRTN
jgi:MYXO-CTERM domain-containing protein